MDLKKNKKKQSVWIKKKDEGVGTFYDGNSFCKIQSGWTSPGGPLDASERGALSQYLAPRMLVKTRYQNIFFFFFSFISYLLIIHHLHLCFCIKDSKRKRESRSDCEKEERRERERKWDYVSGLIKRATRADADREKSARQRKQREVVK